ncbi:MAG: hypothetical protein IKB16_11050 [Lentisphaeria bacterium]|nr:hypothetical protein [Lentisphaeria bacterium]
MAYADILTDVQRRTARLNAIGSAWFGCVAEVLVDSSAFITLYILALGGSAAMAVFVAGFTGVVNMFALIPSATIVTRMGLKRAVKYACLTGCFGLLLAASAPFFGAYGKYVALAGCFIYCFQRPLYTATWYPLLDNFLRPQDRGSFFGVMRFSYMLIIGIPFFIVGLCMGKDASILLLQIVIAFSGLALLGRWFFINRFPIDPNAKVEVPEMKKALNISLHNGPLTGYAVYICMFNMVYTPIYPLTLAYLREYIQLPAGSVQLISTVWIGGQLIPFLLYGYILKKTSLRFLEILCHVTVMFVAAAMFLLPPGIPGFAWFVAALVLILSIAQSFYMCSNSAEMMALARPGNKTMASALCQTYTGFGMAAGRNLTSAVLAIGFLTPHWTLGGMSFNHYQTIYLVCAVFAAIIFILLPIIPSIISKHDDYYEP